MELIMCTYALKGMNLFKTKISTRDLSTALLLLSLLVVYFIPPQVLFNQEHTLCVHKTILGFDCPGCGMTRSMSSFLHGDFSSALMLNVAIVPLVLIIVVHLFSYLYNSPTYLVIRKYAFVLFTVVILAQYFYKAIIYFT